MDGGDDGAATPFGEEWGKARRRVRRMRRRDRVELYTRLLDHVEDGWAYVAPLAGLGHATWNAGRTPEGAVLYFVEIDLVDTYRDIAVTTAGAVRARDWSGAWLDELDAAAGDFHRYLHLARMLSADALRPELWQLLQATSASLLPWVEAFRPFVGALAELLEPKPAGARTRRRT